MEQDASLSCFRIALIFLHQMFDGYDMHAHPACNPYASNLPTLWTLWRVVNNIPLSRNTETTRPVHHYFYTAIASLCH